MQHRLLSLYFFTSVQLFFELIQKIRIAALCHNLVCEVTFSLVVNLKIIFLALL